MTLNDFFARTTEEYKISTNIMYKIAFMVAKNSPELDFGQTEIDNAIFDKIVLMKQNSVPEEIIYTSIKNSLTWDNHLDIRKFWHELGAYATKLGISQEQIKQDIKKYEIDSNRYVYSRIPLMQALNKLETFGFNKWDILADDKFLNLIVIPETNTNVVEDMLANEEIINIIIRMRKEGWSKDDMIRELEKQTNGVAGLNSRKISQALPKDLIENERKVSAKDGSIKYKSSITLLKYVNPVLKFFTENAEQISNLSNKYKDNNGSFARAFYDLYVKKRGWGDFAPKLLINENDNEQMHGGFIPEGFISLNDLSSQEVIVNTIIHELTHFEQYLMLINTRDFGLKPYEKHRIMQAMLKASNAYENDTEKRLVLQGEDFESLPQDNILELQNLVHKHFENDFFHNAKKIPYKEIVKNSGKYIDVKKLSDSLMITYDDNNKGNYRFVYPKLFHEKMAYTVGNAGAVMFRNIVLHNQNYKVSNFNKILDVTTQEM